VDGELHELDVLVLATGFQVDRFVRPIEIVGRNGVALSDVWAQRPSAYLSVSIPDFPNLFLLNGPNGPVGNLSLITVAELQIDYVMQLMALAAGERRREVSARHEALARTEDERVEAVQKTVWVTGCKSWYLDDRGIPAMWPWGIDRFREVMAEPKWDDYDVREAAREEVGSG
jgi:cation diffusion facilitator CzcD-associated flavoprotein CzcO